MEAENQNLLLPSEILSKIYEHVQSKDDRKAWQMVCRPWYLASNYIARIKIRVTADDVVSYYKRLCRDLIEYPTFRPKISTDGDFKNVFMHYKTVLCTLEQEVSNSRYFKFVLKNCPSLHGLWLRPGSLYVLHRYLDSSSYNEETDLPRMQEVHLVDRFLSSTNSDETIMVLLKIAYKLRKSIYSIDCSL